MKKSRLLAFCLALLFSAPSLAEYVNLLKAWQYALVADPSWQVAQADNRYEAAEPAKALAGLLPSLSLSASRYQNTLDREGATTNNPVRYDSSVDAISFRQPLIRLQNLAEYKRAVAHREAADLTLDAATQQLVIRVAQAYFDALLGEDQLRFARTQVNTLTAQQDAAEKSFRSGAGTRIEIDEARSRVAMAQAEALAAENHLANARQRLSTLIATEVTGVAPLAPERLGTLQLSPANLTEWRDLVWRVSPELQAAAKAVDESDWAVHRARAGHLPTLDLLATKARSESETVTTVNSRYDTSSVGLQLTIPILSGGQTPAETTQALARRQRARASYEGLRRELETNVRKEFSGIQQGRERLASLNLALEAALVAVTSTRRGVEAGTRSMLDVLNAERQAHNMRLEVARARYDFVMSRLRLKAMAKQLGEEEVFLINGLLGSGSPLPE